MRQDYLNFRGRARLPVILQTEAAECGLACLGMIASYFGHRIDIDTLRRRHPVSLKGRDAPLADRDRAPPEARLPAAAHRAQPSFKAAPAGNPALGHEPFRGPEGSH